MCVSGRGGKEQGRKEEKKERKNEVHKRIIHIKLMSERAKLPLQRDRTDKWQQASNATVLDARRLVASVNKHLQLHGYHQLTSDKGPTQAAPNSTKTRPAAQQGREEKRKKHPEESRAGFTQGQIGEHGLPGGHGVQLLDREKQEFIIARSCPSCVPLAVCHLRTQSRSKDKARRAISLGRKKTTRSRGSAQSGASLDRMNRTARTTLTVNHGTG